MWLAFGTLLHRGCENVAGIHDDGFHHTHHHKFVVDPETCKTFSIDIYNRFVGATTTAEKILFVKVLGNMALRDNYVYLKPIVNGEQFQPEAVRLNAFWSLAHYAGDLKEEVSIIFYDFLITFQLIINKINQLFRIGFDISSTGLQKLL